MICVACDLTLPTQYIRSLPSGKWKTEREKINREIRSLKMAAKELKKTIGRRRKKNAQSS